MKKIKVNLVKGSKYYILVYLYNDISDYKKYEHNYSNISWNDVQLTKEEFEKCYYRCDMIESPKNLFAYIHTIDGNIPNIVHELYHAACHFYRNMPKNKFVFIHNNSGRLDKPKKEEAIATILTHLVEEYLSKSQV